MVTQAQQNFITQLAIAAKGTILEGKTKEIFQGITQSARVNNLSLEAQQRAYTAVTQIIYKGVVQQEDRGQLSEALPQSVQIFARALHVTPQELNKSIESGQIGLLELLKFAQQLSKESSAVDAVFSRFTASVLRLLAAIKTVLKSF